MDLTKAPPSASVLAFAEEVGVHDPVTVVGGRTHWHVGRPVDAGARTVRAPVGGIVHEPAEMIVRVSAGTTVGDLDAVLAEHGQMCPLDPADPSRATVGGVLATGYSGVRRLRYGPVRDLVLEARYVAADGKVVKAGAPVVKNVTGYDLCRLLVGSLGTLGFLAEVVLRCRPRPAASLWLRADDAVDAVGAAKVCRTLYGPSSVLYDGEHVWVLIEGHPADLVDQRSVLSGLGRWTETEASHLPVGARLSLDPSQIGATAAAGGFGGGRWVAEMGVGTVHTDQIPTAHMPTAHMPADHIAGVVAPVDAALHQQIKAAYDPTGRMNPGRWWW